MKYRKKPVVIEAVQWTGNNHAEMCEFIDPEVFEIIPRVGLVIHTLEGDHHASPGDYIIKGVNGEFYPCKPDIFAKTYEAALPTLTPQNEWVSVEERLPESTEHWETYIVTVNRSHWPTSSFDPCDAPYNEELVAVAQYDSKQKIWHLSWDEQLNALIQADDAPLNGDFVTHWMELPAPPDRRPPEGEA